MKKALRKIGRILLILFLIIAAFYGVAFISFYKKANREYSFAVAPEVKVDTSLVSRGEHLVAIKGCNQCHGNDLSGKILEDDALIGRIVAPNLTRGIGGLDAKYTIEDWIRALQHGIGLDRKALQFMPSNETATLTSQDLSALISYCTTVAPVNRELPAARVGPLAKVLSLFDKIPV